MINFMRIPFIFCFVFYYSVLVYPLFQNTPEEIYIRDWKIRKDLTEMLLINSISQDIKKKAVVKILSEHPGLRLSGFAKGASPLGACSDEDIAYLLIKNKASLIETQPNELLALQTLSCLINANSQFDSDIFAKEKVNSEALQGKMRFLLTNFLKRAGQEGDIELIEYILCQSFFVSKVLCYPFAYLIDASSLQGEKNLSPYLLAYGLGKESLKEEKTLPEKAVEEYQERGKLAISKETFSCKTDPYLVKLLRKIIEREDGLSFSRLIHEAKNIPFMIDILFHTPDTQEGKECLPPLISFFSHKEFALQYTKELGKVLDFSSSFLYEKALYAAFSSGCAPEVLQTLIKSHPLGANQWFFDVCYKMKEDLPSIKSITSTLLDFFSCFSIKDFSEKEQAWAVCLTSLVQKFSPSDEQLYEFLNAASSCMNAGRFFYTKNCDKMPSLVTLTYAYSLFSYAYEKGHLKSLEYILHLPCFEGDVELRGGVIAAKIDHFFRYPFLHSAADRLTLQMIVAHALPTMKFKDENTILHMLEKHEYPFTKELYERFPEAAYMKNKRGYTPQDIASAVKTEKRLLISTPLVLLIISALSYGAADMLFQKFSVDFTKALVGAFAAGAVPFSLFVLYKVIKGEVTLASVKDFS